METIARSRALSALVLCLIASVTLLFRLGSLPLFGPDEPRYARIAEEMHQAGGWVTPLLEGKAWLEKPPLYYWLTIPSFALFGVSELTARLGNALLALAAAFSVLWLGRRIHTPLAGLWGAGILLTSLGFAAFGRSATTDLPFTVCFAWGMSLLAAASCGRAAPWSSAAAAGVFIGLAVLAKGPVAWLLGAGIWLAFWWLHEGRSSLRIRHLAAAVAVSLAVALPWFWLAYVENGSAFVTVFLVNHNLARFISPIHHHVQPFWYFLPVLLGLMFPWSGWLALFVRKLRSPRRWETRTLFMAAWAVVPFVFFSLSQSKLPGYILPCLPPIALLLGHRLEELRGADRVRRALAPAMWFYLALSAGVAAAFAVLFVSRYGGEWGLGLGLSAATLLPALAVVHFVRAGRVSGLWRGTLLQGAVIALGVLQLAHPVLGRHHSTREIARLSMAARLGNEPVASYRFFHHTLHYYTGYRVAAHLENPAALQEFAAEHPRFLIVTEAIRLEELDAMPELTAAELGAQGKLRLLRISRR